LNTFLHNYFKKNKKIEERNRIPYLTANMKKMGNRNRIGKNYDHHFWYFL